MNVTPVRTRVFKEKENLARFVAEHVPRLEEGSVLAISSKVVALSEGRVKRPKNAAEKGRIIQSECEWMVATKYVALTFKDGVPMANAGADESNAGGTLILLPKDSFASAQKLRRALMKKYKLKKLGIIVTDSRVMPLRAGVVGIALGYAGIKGLRDYRGKRDMFGRTLKYTQTDIADGLATAAVVVAGEGKEQQPIVVIEQAPVAFTEKVNTKELRIDIENDLYRPFFGRFGGSEL